MAGGALFGAYFVAVMGWTSGDPAASLLPPPPFPWKLLVLPTLLMGLRSGDLDVGQVSSNAIEYWTRFRGPEGT